ncbi:hypothetical protein [Streptomyces albireticuli]|uniref:hypothetical protein n=1 Tax=Streptomyces albireticuli TaxID=1940 RepID=UPI0036B80E5C
MNTSPACPTRCVYLGHLDDALGLLDVAGKKATMPATKALVASQTGDRVYAALGDGQGAERHLGAADELVADGLGDVPAWVDYFHAAEHAGARAVSACDLAGTGRNRRASAVPGARPGCPRIRRLRRRAGIRPWSTASTRPSR